MNTSRHIRFLSLSIALATLLFSSQIIAGSLLVQSTTSTANSGLYKHLLPLFEEASGINVKVVAVGTGQAIRNARNCDADILLVHAKSEEERFVADGFGKQRSDLMYNDFIVVGPPQDPAGIHGTNDVIAAFRSISKTKSLFASRGDDSGTHKKEMSLWQQAGLAPDGKHQKWYRSTGSGMGATLNTAIGLGAYVLTDRATWISFGNKTDFHIMTEGDDQLFNQYGIILVNQEKCPNVNSDDGQRMVDWLLSDNGQRAIGEYRRDDQQLFFPNAGL